MNKLNKLLLVGLLAVSFSPIVVPVTPVSAATCAQNGDTVSSTSGFCKRSCTGGDVTYSESGPRGACPVTSTSDFFLVLDRIFTVGASIVGIIAALFILVAAFTYITSHGDEEKVGKAKDTIVYAVIGIVIAALAYGVPVVIRTLLGL